MIFINIILLLIGMLLLIKGADFFVDGASSIARIMKIPPLIIGLTLVSMGTSAPETSVSINSAINNLNDLSIGNILGANIINTLMVLGICAIILPITINKDIKNFDLPILILMYVLFISFSFIITPYILDIFEGIIMLVVFVLYIVLLIVRAKKTTPILEEEQTKMKPLWLSIILSIIGLVGVIFGGELVVNNAADLAIKLGMSQKLVGLTIVSIGTTLPELITSVVASKKHEDAIAIGNVIGSCAFNIIFILGLASSIKPLIISSSTLIDMLIMTFSAITILIISLTSTKIKKWHGLLLIAMYAAFLTFAIIRN